MKRICLALSCFAVVHSAPVQAAALVATSLGQYAKALQAPARVAVDPAGCVYVTDPQRGQVVVFDAFGRLVSTHTGFARPLGIAVDAQGTIYVAEEKTGSVSVLDAQWHLLYQLGAGAGEFLLPNHIALAPGTASHTVYVSDSRANEVRVYLGNSRHSQFGAYGTGPGQFNFPTGVCVSPAGEVFVVDQNNDRVQVFDSAGKFLRAFNLGTTQPSGRSQAALLDNAGRLYVADTFQGTVKVLDALSGDLLSTVGAFGQGPGHLNAPAGIALDTFGRLYIASANNARLELYGLDSFLHLRASPATDTIASGASLMLSAILGGSGPFAFEWQKDGQSLANATNATLWISTVSTADAGAYSVVVKGPAATVNSSIAWVTVIDPPAILAGPQSATVLRGTDVSLEAIAAGTALNYQWRLNGLDIPDATQSTLTLPDVQVSQAGAYSISVSNAVGVTVSSPAFITVLTPPTVVEILSSTIQTDQLFHITVNVDPGFTYALETSTNLVEWWSVTNFVNDAGLLDISDLTSANDWCRFYRLHWIP